VSPRSTLRTLRRITRLAPHLAPFGPRGFAARGRRAARPIAAAVALALCAGVARAGGAQPSADSLPVVRSGDRLAVSIWREPELSQTLTVDQAGEVFLPRLGRMRVAGITVEGLPDTLRSRYAEFLRNPSVDVKVLRRVGVFGAVKAPNLYYVDVTTTLGDVIALAGGIEEDGRQNEVLVVRDEQRMKLKGWRERGAGVELRSGDRVVVERRNWIARNGIATFSSLAVAVSVLISATR
jgi:polysaccharide export outer membrane protein